jgi:hypothetical protein
MGFTRKLGAFGLAAAACALVLGCAGAMGTVNDEASAKKASEIVYQGLSSSLDQGSSGRVAPRAVVPTENGFIYTQDGGGSVEFSFTTEESPSDLDEGGWLFRYTVTFGDFVVAHDDGTGEAEYELSGSVHVDYGYQATLASSTFEMLVWSTGVGVTGADISDTVAMDVLYSWSYSIAGDVYTASGSVSGTVNGYSVEDDSWSFSYSGL